MTTDLAESIIDASEILSREDKKECIHYWANGYIADHIIYCKKCDKEIQDIEGYGGYSIYQTHIADNNGNLVRIEENYKTNKEDSFFIKIKKLLSW